MIYSLIIYCIPLIGFVLARFKLHIISIVLMIVLTIETYLTTHSYTFEWFRISNIPINFTSQTNSIGNQLVCTISCVIQIYSLEYLSSTHEKHRFISLLNFFTVSMLVIINAKDIIQFFLGWEGVGIASYLLISFEKDNLVSAKGAQVALLMNKIGDIAFIIIIYIMYHNGSFALSSLPSQNIFFSYCILIASICKSAQIGMHLWLLYAMEGLTPVSALLHSATMVIAGVLLLIAMYDAFVLHNVLLVIAIITCLYSSIMANISKDLKSIIAYSTCAQIGLMFIAIGVEDKDLALNHIMSHGFFKATIFLLAGIVIKTNHHNRNIFILQNKPHILVMIGFIISLLDLCGLPIFWGGHTKDAMLVSALQKNIFAFIGCFLTTCFSVGYAIRIIYYTCVKPLQKHSLNGCMIMVASTYVLIAISLSHLNLQLKLFDWLIFCTCSILGAGIFMICKKCEHAESLKIIDWLEYVFSKIGNFFVSIDRTEDTMNMVAKKLINAGANKIMQASYLFLENNAILVMASIFIMMGLYAYK